jgi:hypothetical protein
VIRHGLWVGIAAGMISLGVVCLGRYDSTWTWMAGSVLLGAGVGMVARSPWVP